MKDVLTVAAIRAFVTATVVGATAALGVYSTTDEFKPIFVAGATAFLGIIAARLGVEGTIDATRKPPESGETAVRTEPPLG
jgi:hypothetical protein